MYLARRWRMPHLGLPSHPPLEDIFQLFPLNVQPAWHYEHGLDVSTVPTALGCAHPPPSIPVLAAAASEQGPAVYYLPCDDEGSVTQMLNVTEQLDAGVWYVDLRIAHMLEGSERNLHFVHLVYTTALVEDTLTEVSDWLEQHPREVVILACRNFEGMTEGLHEYLDTCIHNIFGDMLCPRGEVPTLHQLWARGQQVLMSYEDEGTVSRQGALWPRIPYWWGDQVKPEELVHYLEHIKSRGRPGGLFVAGINLTKNLAYILLRLSESLKTMMLPSLPYLSRWVQEQCPGLGTQCTNIIAGNFIGTDAFTSDVIQLNEKLLPC
ncbi:hypothetical protein MC885_009321 [Smutsia gigantea]|nr:hypothetical protein MC885_009321 [Smutsia gigantea]